MANGNVSIQILKGLEPLSALSSQRLTELGELCVVERVSKTLDPFRVKGIAGQLVEHRERRDRDAERRSGKLRDKDGSRKGSPARCRRPRSGRGADREAASVENA